MGAQFFHETVRGKSMADAYKRACEEAEEEYGHQQGYSGQINASAGFTDITSQYKSSILTIGPYIDKVSENLSKHNGAQGICTKEPVVNNNKIKSVVDHKVFKGARKWNLVYTVHIKYKHSLKSYDNKGDAVKAARVHTEKTGESTYIKIERVLDKSSGSDVVAEIKYKASTKEAEGNYVFFGYASC